MERRCLRLLCPELRASTLTCLRQGTIETCPVGGIAEDVRRIVEAAGKSTGGAALVQREVVLGLGSGERKSARDRDGESHGEEGEDDGGDASDAPMVYAASWWSEETFRAYMTDSRTPMWTNLREKNVELYREVRAVYRGEVRSIHWSPYDPVGVVNAVP
jgi:hypothetical protein